MAANHFPERAINSVASFLSTTTGFLITFVALLVGVGIGALLQFNDAFMFGFNILLSVAAIVISGIILVSGARSEAALHVKLDYLIEFPKPPTKPSASNTRTSPKSSGNASGSSRRRGMRSRTRWRKR